MRTAWAGQESPRLLERRRARRTVTSPVMLAAITATRARTAAEERIVEMKSRNADTPARRIATMTEKRA